MNQLSKSTRMWTSVLTKLARKSTKDLHAPIVLRWIFQVLKSAGWFWLHKPQYQATCKESSNFQAASNLSTMWYCICICIFWNPPTGVMPPCSLMQRGRRSRHKLIIAGTSPVLVLWWSCFAILKNIICLPHGDKGGPNRRPSLCFCSNWEMKSVVLGPNQGWLEACRRICLSTRATMSCREFVTFLMCLYTAMRTNQEDTIAVYGKFRDSIKTKHTTFICPAKTYPSKFQHWNSGKLLPG